MKKQIKKLIALLLVICMSFAYIPASIKADTTDRVLTSEDIPDENLYNTMLIAGDMDANGELTLSEASAISFIEILKPISSFEGLELIENVRVGIYGYSDSDEQVTEDELKVMIESLVNYNNIYSLLITGVFIDEEIFDNVTKMALEEFDGTFSDVTDFSFMEQADITDKPFYETVNNLSLLFPVNVDPVDFSLNNLKQFTNLTRLELSGGINILDVDTISRYQTLTCLILSGYYPKDAELDLSSNTSLVDVNISNENDEKLLVTLGDNDNITDIILNNVCFNESPVNCISLHIYNSNLENMKLDFSEYENLATLSISNCDIDEITGLENCNNLNLLDLSNNNLTKVPFDWSERGDVYGLDLSGNYLTKEDVIANVPEQFASNIRWVLSALSRKIITINKMEFREVYTEFNTDYFESVLDMYVDDGYIYEHWYTNCNEIVLEKSVLEWAANRTDDVIFNFQHVDELGNIAYATVNLAEALEDLNDDCVIEFDFNNNESTIDIWNTENVYIDLHKKYGVDNTYIEGVTYCYDYSGIAYNIYYDSAVPYKYGVDELAMRTMVENAEFSDSNTYYYIPVGADPNYEATADEGVNAGKQNVYEEDIYGISMDYDTIYDMPDGSVVNTSSSYGSFWVNKDIWNLIISKKMTLNMYMLDSSNLYIDGIIILSYDNMCMFSEELTDTSIFFEYDFLNDGLTKYCYCVGEHILEGAKIKLYVGDIAKNGETVCAVKEYEYIGEDKHKKVGYEILNEYSVEAGMVEMSYLPNPNGLSWKVSLRNKNDIAIYNELPLPSGDFITYEKGDEIVSLSNKMVDNIDFRGCTDGFTVSCDCTFSEIFEGDKCIFSLEDRTNEEEYYMTLKTDSMGFLEMNIADGDDYIFMLLGLGSIPVKSDEEHHMDVVVENVDDILYVTIYVDGTQLEVINATNATSGNATSGNAVYNGNGVSEFDITLLNTIYCNEGTDFYLSNVELTVYAGNIFAEDKEETEDGSEEGTGDTGNDTNTESGDDKTDGYEEPERIEDDEIVDSDTVIEEILNNVADEDNNTIEVITDGSQIIGKDAFDIMLDKGKNIIYGVVDENNELKYSWSFASKYITHPDMSMDLHIEINEEHKKIDKKLYDKDALYVNFKHHGKLPGPSTVKVYVGNKYKEGEKVQMYYYDEANDKILKVGKQPLVVKDGYLEFTISHCSTYFVMEQQKALELDVEQNIQLDENSFENINFNIINVAVSDVEAGYDTNVAMIYALIFMIFASSTIFILTIRKKMNN